MISESKARSANNDDALEREELILQIKELAAKTEEERKAARKALKELRKFMDVIDEFFGDMDQNRIIHRTGSDSSLYVPAKK